MPDRSAAAQRRLSSLTLGVCASLALTAFWLLPTHADDPAEKAKPVPLFAKTEPAGNPTRLSLQADDQQIVGWISGTADFAGREVTVASGDRVEKLTVGKDNTFVWKHRATKPASVLVKVADLRGSVRVAPAAEKEPTVFFVIDRSVYRPAQTLQFAGFLRRLNTAGDFEPLTNRTAEVVLRSKTKGTMVAKLQLPADEFGRITGQYTFADADPLDDYTLSVPGYRGEAKLTVSEYRKSKVKLKIDSEVAGDRLKLKFQAVDFLEKPVAGSKVSFTAQVVLSSGRSKEYALKGEDFVYPSPPTNGAIDFDNLTEDELLLWEAEGVSPSGFGRGDTVLAQLTGEVALRDREPGEHTVDLRKEWLKEGVKIVVQGIVTDANGREQRATRTIPLRDKTAAVSLDLTKHMYAVDEPIEVRLRAVEADGKPVAGATSVVVERLKPAAVAMNFELQEQLGGQFDAYQRVRSSYRPNGISRARQWQMVAPTETSQRTMVTAAVVQDGVATVKLTEPGAYKLVAITTRKDGSTVRGESSCLVRNPEDFNGLVLQLTKDEFSAGERLTGTLHSRFRDARVLLTVRDSRGIRLTAPLQMKGSTLEIDQALPSGLSYGCLAEVQYLDEADQIHLASQYTRIVPTDRTLTVKATTKESYGPGETIKLDLSVDRAEPVDLVVSVYDQSLLGVAADKSGDVRNFYLADERLRGEQAQRALRRQLGERTLGSLIKRAEELLKDNKELTATPEGIALQNLIATVRNHRILNAYQLRTLLHVAGIDLQLHADTFTYRGYNWHVATGETGETTPVIDLLEKSNNEWRLAFQYHHGAFLLSETHPAFATAEMANFYALRRYSAWNGGPNGSPNGGINNLQLQMLQLPRTPGTRMARGDAGGFSSGNASHSVEGQAFMSHLPAVGSPVELLTPDVEQGGIAVRRDFSDSAFWKSNVRTDANGKATVEFKLPDSLTNWQVVVTAVSPRMHVGQARTSFRTTKPIMVWPMLPRYFTEGDKVRIFASVHNRTADRQSIRVKLKVENGKIATNEEQTVEVPPEGNAPVYWTFAPGSAGFTQLLMTADCAAGSDASLKRLPVVRCGAEQVLTQSGLCKDAVNLKIPGGINLDTASLEITLAPSLAADMADTLNYLVEYPYGCVEQTMSKFLPAIKVAQLLKQYHVNHPELEKKLPGCVQGGIKRLLELQQPDGGWGWTGNAQTHEMMTPYALYGLLQAEKAGYTIPVENAVQRGLDRLRGFIEAMGEAQTADRIYCLYVYSLRRDVQEDWWQFIAEQLKKGKLSDYALALSLEMAVQKDHKELADKLATALRNRAQRPGGRVHWVTAGFGHWGDDRFEITAAAMKALVAYDIDDPLIDGILGFFTSTKHGNRWNSTKDTAMILYAMCDYLSRQKYDPQADASVSCTVNDGAANKVVFTDGLAQKVTVAGNGLKVGDNRLAFATRATGIMYRVVVRYWQAGRDVGPMDKGISVVRHFYLLDGKGGRRQLKSGEAVPRGSYIESEVTAHYPLGGMSYVLVEDHKPAGCEVLPATDPRFPHSSTPCALREERLAHVAFHHEQTPQDLVDRCVFLAEMAGEFVAPPAFVEMMYQTETRGHSGSFVLKVAEDAR